MWHVFFLVVFILVLFLDERECQNGDLKVSGLIACRVSNVYKFSYIFTQWGRFLKHTGNVHCFQAETTSDIQVDDLDKKGNVITEIFLHIHTVGPLSHMHWQIALFSVRNGHRRHSSATAESSRQTLDLWHRQRLDPRCPQHGLARFFRACIHHSGVFCSHSRAHDWVGRGHCSNYVLHTWCPQCRSGLFEREASPSCPERGR